jgi:hypothetical protein
VWCAQQTCRQRGAGATVIGYDESGPLGVVPAQRDVRVIKRK